MNPNFPGEHGHISYSFLHQTKPKTSYFDHLKYELDMSTHAREMWGVKFASPVAERMSHLTRAFNVPSWADWQAGLVVGWGLGSFYLTDG